MERLRIQAQMKMDNADSSDVLGLLQDALS